MEQLPLFVRLVEMAMTIVVPPSIKDMSLGEPCQSTFIIAVGVKPAESSRGRVWLLSVHPSGDHAVERAPEAGRHVRGTHRWRHM